MKLKLTLQYNGAAFGGWQFQPVQGAPVLPSVQGTLASALGKLWGGTNVPPQTLMAAGRTDAGVHALGQICHAEGAKPMDLIKYLDGLNHFLPTDIRVTRVAEVEENFDARRSATARHYHYYIQNTRVLRPHWHGQMGHVVQPLNVEAMRAALTLLPTTETDFTSFRDAECQSHTPFCHLLHRELKEKPFNVLRFEFSADHFLHHMVRNLVGTFLEVGLGKRAPESLPELLAAKDRRLAGPTFMPDGLYFMGVDYIPHREIATTDGSNPA